MVTLAHFSDPHLGPMLRPKPWQLLSKRILGYINWQRNRAKTFSDLYLNALIADLKEQNPDHIALTGDLVNIALPSEIERARLWLKHVGPADMVSVVPGNHDAYVPGALRNAKRAWQPYMLGDTSKGGVGFPYLRKRGPLAIIACSTANASLPFMATGTFSRAQANATARLLHQNKHLCRVVLIHHPPMRAATPAYKRMIGAHRFRDIIAQHGAELVLHGHTHINSTATLHGPLGPVPVIGIASASNGPGHTKPSGSYNMFQIEGTTGTWSIRHKRYGITNSAGHVDLLNETALTGSGC